MGGARVLVPAACLLGLAFARMASADRQTIAPGIGSQSSVVIHTGNDGICATLAQRDDVLHVHCYAPHEALVERTMKREGVSEDEADRMVKAKNQQREAYVKRMFGRAWLAPEQYHIMLNTAWLGQDRCVSLVLELAHERFGTEPAKSN